MSDANRSVRQLAESVCTSWLPVVAEIRKSRRSLRSIAAEANIDNNLLSTLCRGVESDDVLYGLSEIPGPAGLQRLLAGLRGLQGLVSDSAHSQIRDSIHHYERMSSDFLGGRAAIVNVAARLQADAGRKQSRRLAQQAYSSLSKLFGCHAQTTGGGVIISPSMVTESIAYTHLSVFNRFRRLQDRTPIEISGYRARGGEQSPESAEGIRLDEETAHHIVVQEASTPGLSENLQIKRQSDFVRLVLPHDYPSVDKTINFATAYHREVAERRFCTDTSAWHTLRVIPAMPTRLLLFDVFVHNSLGDGRFDWPLAEPVALATTPLDSSNAKPENLVGLNIDFELLHGEGIDSRLIAAGIPNYSSLFESLFQLRRLDPSEFTWTRLAVPYCPLGIRVTIHRQRPVRK